jgi:glycosyltransferase involved in cell wall biosynthesis
MQLPSLTLLVCVHSTTDYHDQLLIRALNSIKHQTYKSFKTLIILDKCHNKTKAIIQSQNYDLDLELIENESGKGLANAKNIGLSHITTELVSYLDGDDYIHTQKIEKQIKFMSEHPEIQFLGVMGYNFDDAVPNVFGNVYEVGQYETHEQISARIYQENMIIHGGVMFRKACVDQLGGYHDVRYAEDWHLWRRAIQAGFRFHILQERLYYYSLGTSVPQ